MAELFKIVLHVGAGHPESGAKLPPVFKTGDWKELRLDIDPRNMPDILGSMPDMHAIADGTIDAVYSSHCIEHLSVHEIPILCREFFRILKRDGFVLVTCPDLQAIVQMIAEERMADPLYVSPAGPISTLDIIYGHGTSIERGNNHMRHKCGFTIKLLLKNLHENGFPSVAGMRRPAFYDLWAVAFKGRRDDEELSVLAGQFLPEQTKS